MFLNQLSVTEVLYDHLIFFFNIKYILK